MQGSGDDGAALVAQLEPLSSTLVRAANRVIEPAAITSTQKQLLLELVDSVPLRLGALAHRVGATAPTTSRAVDGLVAAKLVKRQPDPNDRRAVLHVASPRGEAWVERRRAVVVAALNDALSGLSAVERKSLLALTAKLNEQLR